MYKYNMEIQIRNPHETSAFRDETISFDHMEIIDANIILRDVDHRVRKVIDLKKLPREVYIKVVKKA